MYNCQGILQLTDNIKYYEYSTNFRENVISIWNNTYLVNESLNAITEMGRCDYNQKSNNLAYNRMIKTIKIVLIAKKIPYENQQGKYGLRQSCI